MRKLAICSNCKKTKPYHAKRLCKSCYSEAYRLTHKAEKRARARKYRLEHRDEEISRNRKYYLNHKEELDAKHLLYMKEYRIINQEFLKARNKKYYLITKEEKKIKALKYYRENSIELNIKRRESSKTEEGRLKARIKSLKKRVGFSAEVVEEIINNNVLKYGNICCEKCKNEAINNYHIDYIIPLSCGGDNSYDNLQVLCSKCNQKKFIEIVDYREIFKEGQMFLRK